MRFRFFPLLAGLFYVSAMSAAAPQVEITDVRTQHTSDSAVVVMSLQVDMEKMADWNSLRIDPVVVENTSEVAMSPALLLNGKRQHSTYKRNLVFAQREGKDLSAEQASEYDGGRFSRTYRVAVPVSLWSADAAVKLRCRLFDKKQHVLEEQIVDVISAQRTSSSVAASIKGKEVTVQQDKNVVYQGSYMTPESDAIDARNEKELRFSLDEAKIIAEINPELLSLRELYAVATAYKDNSVMFHKIIKRSVDIYPSSPIANLNAAASAIEQGDAAAAAAYLQVAPHDVLAYKNCQGAYELMCNHIPEGLRLLKDASAQGSKEATENLKRFFGSFSLK